MIPEKNLQKCGVLYENQYIFLYYVLNSLNLKQTKPHN